MIHRVAILLLCAAILPSCKKEGEVVVSDTRPAIARDASPKLFATSDERFRNAKPSPVRAETPEGWLVQPPTDIRLLNYRFGPSGTGEVWVSISSGTVLDNVNRWVAQQFGAPAMDAAGLETLRKVPIAGTTGVWVEASGTYSSGMGSPPRDGYALAGVVAQLQNRILTVKMVGPRDDVESAKAMLESFSAKLTAAP
jgi:hypothetical protein